MQLTVLVAKMATSNDTYTEALAVVDEYTLDENPQWWTDTVARELKSREPELVNHAFLRITVPDAVIDRALADTFDVTAHAEVSHP